MCELHELLAEAGRKLSSTESVPVTLVAEPVLRMYCRPRFVNLRNVDSQAHQN